MLQPSNFLAPQPSSASPPKTGQPRADRPATSRRREAAPRPVEPSSGGGCGQPPSERSHEAARLPGRPRGRTAVAPRRRAGARPTARARPAALRARPRCAARARRIIRDETARRPIARARPAAPRPRCAAGARRIIRDETAPRPRRYGKYDARRRAAGAAGRRRARGRRDARGARERQLRAAAPQAREPGAAPPDRLRALGRAVRGADLRDVHADRRDRAPRRVQDGRRRVYVCRCRGRVRGHVGQHLDGVQSRAPRGRLLRLRAGLRPLAGDGRQRLDLPRERRYGR